MENHTNDNPKTILTNSITLLCNNLEDLKYESCENDNHNEYDEYDEYYNDIRNETKLENYRRSIMKQDKKLKRRNRTNA